MVAIESIVTGAILGVIRIVLVEHLHKGAVIAVVTLLIERKQLDGRRIARCRAFVTVGARRTVGGTEVVLLRVAIGGAFGRATIVLYGEDGLFVVVVRGRPLLLEGHREGFPGDGFVRHGSGQAEVGLVRHAHIAAVFVGSRAEVPSGGEVGLGQNGAHGLLADASGVVGLRQIAVLLQVGQLADDELIGFGQCGAGEIVPRVLDVVRLDGHAAEVLRQQIIIVSPQEAHLVAVARHLIGLHGQVAIVQRLVGQLYAGIAILIERLYVVIVGIKLVAMQEIVHLVASVHVEVGSTAEKLRLTPVKASQGGVRGVHQTGVALLRAIVGVGGDIRFVVGVEEAAASRSQSAGEAGKRQRVYQ